MKPCALIMPEPNPGPCSLWPPRSKITLSAVILTPGAKVQKTSEAMTYNAPGVLSSDPDELTGICAAPGITARIMPAARLTHPRAPLKSNMFPPAFRTVGRIRAIWHQSEKLKSNALEVLPLFRASVNWPKNISTWKRIMRPCLTECKGDKGMSRERINRLRSWSIDGSGQRGSNGALPDLSLSQFQKQTITRIEVVLQS